MPPTIGGPSGSSLLTWRVLKIGRACGARPRPQNTKQNSCWKQGQSQNGARQVEVVTGAMLFAPMHQGNRRSASKMWVSTTTSRHPAPRVCRKEPIVFRREKVTAAPIKSRDTGTNAISALSKVAFMAIDQNYHAKRDLALAAALSLLRSAPVLAAAHHFFLYL